MTLPSPNGRNGRDATGRFTTGNPGGPGNPHGRHVAALRLALLESVSDAQLKAIMGKLVKMALAGDVLAAREVLNRVVGRPGISMSVEVVNEPEPDLPMPEVLARLYEMAEQQRQIEARELS